MNINFNSNLFSFLIITSILCAFPTDKKSDRDETKHKIPIPSESRVIVGEGAKVIVGTKALAKLWYDKLILISDAKLVEDEDSKPELSKVTNADNSIEIAEAEEASLPTELSISKAYPNPFNPVVNVRFGLPKEALVHILIHDITGRLIGDYKVGNRSAGWHEFSWNATNMLGQAVGTGIYLLTVQAGDKLQKQKITYIK